jgi:D-tyrosyl-tRNA(Tyr) deacylase
MIALIQRVIEASVEVEGRMIGSIGAGILGLVGVRPLDTPESARRLAGRIVTFRIFADAHGRMNRSVQDIAGEVLLVPQFTLAADTRSGTRPGFSTAAPPEAARQLFDELVRLLRELHPPLQTGQFGANMQVRLTNDGPVTFWLES